MFLRMTPAAPLLVRRCAMTILALALAPLVAFADVPPQSTDSVIATRARKVLESITSTTYVHKTDIDEKAGKFNCDCSGLVGFIVKKELPEHFKVLPVSGSGKRPRAVDFANVFLAASTTPQAGALWQRIDKLADARPGDVMAWKKDPQPPTGNTGHVVVIDAVPREVSAGLWAVTIIDSTTKGHEADTRKTGETGVGRGTMYFKTDDAGSIVSRAARSAKGPWESSPTAIGRPILK